MSVNSGETADTLDIAGAAGAARLGTGTVASPKSAITTADAATRIRVSG
jgi:hypothetical protein